MINLEDLQNYIILLDNIEWSKDILINNTKQYCSNKQIKLKDFLQTIRFLLTGKFVGLSFYDILIILQKNKVLYKLNHNWSINNWEVLIYSDKIILQPIEEDKK